MSNQFYILAVAGLLVYAVLFYVDRRWGRRLLNQDFNQRERLMAASLTKSEGAFKRLELTVDLLKEQLDDKDKQSAERDVRIAALTAEVTTLRDQVEKDRRTIADLTQQLEAKKLIEPPSPTVPTVLLVAPSSDLPLVSAEVQDISRSGLEVTPIYSPISQLSLIREIRVSKCDGLWIAGHMNAAGDIPLDNGQVLPSSALTSLVRGRFRWVYLNACQSVFAAQQLQNETGADVICTILDVPDEDAYRTGSLFAVALAQLRDTRAAYDESLPGGNRTYLFLGGRSKR